MHIIYIYVYIKNTYYYLLCIPGKPGALVGAILGKLAAGFFPFCGFFTAPAKSQCPCKKKTSAVVAIHKGGLTQDLKFLAVIGSQ